MTKMWSPRETAQGGELAASTRDLQDLIPIGDLHLAACCAVHTASLESTPSRTPSSSHSLPQGSFSAVQPTWDNEGTRLIPIIPPIFSLTARAGGSQIFAALTVPQRCHYYSLTALASALSPGCGSLASCSAHNSCFLRYFCSGAVALPGGHPFV